MSILDEQRERDLEDYQSYKITLALKGKMTPSFDGAVRLINSRRKDGRNGYQHNAFYNCYFSDGRGNVPG